MKEKLKELLERIETTVDCVKEDIENNELDYNINKDNFKEIIENAEEAVKILNKALELEKAYNEAVKDLEV